MGLSRDQVFARLEILRDFVNTRDVSGGGDGLGTAGELREWFAARELPAPDPEAAPSIRAFREGLREALLANGGHGRSEVAMAALEPHLRGIRFALERSGAGSLVLRPADPGTPGAFEALAVMIYEAMNEGSWARLKACAKESCQDAFIDRSKNGSGQWCSMAVCGNRVKAQRRRLRDRQNS